MKISDFLAPTDVIIDVRASEKAEILQNLASRIAAPLELPPATLASALLRREALGSTGTGNGVAIPHTRLPDLQRAYGLFGRLGKAIDFDSIDGMPVDLIFVLLLPNLTNGEQLSALACVARKLRDAQTLANLRSAKSGSQLYAAVVE
jgi:nitrogen PTS system EIIA component